MAELLQASAFEIIAVVLSVLAGSVFSAFDAALRAYGEVRLMAAKEEGGRHGATAERILAAGEALMTRIYTARVMALMIAAGYTVYLTEDMGGWWVTAAAIALVGFIQAALDLGAAGVARGRAVTWTLPMARYLRPMELLAWPLAAPLATFASLFTSRFPSPPPQAPQDEEETAVREVEHMIEKREESGSLSGDFAELLRGVLEFKDTVAREVMVPRTQMKAIALGTPLEEILEMIQREGHSRYPIYIDRPDQIEGVLYAKDLFQILKDPNEARRISLESLIRRPPFFVAESRPIGKLLREMQTRRFHLAIVVDEFGGTSGIVTLEDIVEEIVGEIRDEHDQEETGVQELGPDQWLVDASMSLHDLGAMLDVEFGEDEATYDSLGGMLVELSDRVPAVGEAIEAQEHIFHIREADERHITKVEIRRRASFVPEETPVAAS